MKLLSGFKFTFIVLIVLPSIVVISHFLINTVIIDYFKSISTPATVQQNLEHAITVVQIFSTFQIIVFIIMIIIYPPYPAPYSAEKVLIPSNREYCLLLCKRFSISSCSCWYFKNGICTFSKKIQVVLCEGMSFFS